jgi:urease accessory protein
VLINTAGGLTGGDRLQLSVDVGTMAAATITTQACEKFYRARDGHAEVSCGLSVGAGGRLAWLPQETIVFERAAFSRRLDADLGDGAEALVVEATVFGRRAMGEAVGHAVFRDRWRIRHNGRLTHAQDLAIGPDVAGTLSRARPSPAGPSPWRDGRSVAELMEAGAHVVSTIRAWRASPR